MKTLPLIAAILTVTVAASLAEPTSTTRVTEPTPASSKWSWIFRVTEQLERNKHYPASAPRDGKERIVRVLFTLDREGRVIDVRVVGSSGSTVFDEEALALVRRSQPFPLAPQELQGQRFMLPVRFNPKPVPTS
jgi:periplasmic protein TonB